MISTKSLWAFLGTFAALLLLGGIAATQSTPGSGISTKAIQGLENCFDSGGNFICTRTGIIGPGTTNKVSKFVGTFTIGDSNITDDGSAITIDAPTSVTMEASTGDVTIGSLGRHTRIYSDHAIDNWVAIGSNALPVGRWMFDTAQGQLEIYCQGVDFEMIDRDDSSVGGTGVNGNMRFIWRNCEPIAGSAYPEFEFRATSNGFPVNGNDLIRGLIIAVDPDTSGAGSNNVIEALQITLSDDDPAPYDKVLGINISDEFNLGIKLPNNTKAVGLETNVSNGTITYCTNCNKDATCTTGGTGAFAFRVTGAWVCELP